MWTGDIVVVFEVTEEGDGLKALAQSYAVREDAVQVVVVQRDH